MQIYTPGVYLHRGVYCEYERGFSRDNHEHSELHGRSMSNVTGGPGTHDRYETKTRETTRIQQGGGGGLSGTDEEDRNISIQMENDTTEDTAATQGCATSNYEDVMAALKNSQKRLIHGRLCLMPIQCEMNLNLKVNLSP